MVIAGPNIPPPVRAAIERFPARSFVATFALCAVVALVQGATEFYYDAAHYWRLRDAFNATGSFSLLAFADPLRGYLFPLVNRGLAGTGGVFDLGDATIVRLFNAAVFAVIGGVLAPRFAQLAWPDLRLGVGRRLALTGLLLLFWHGYLLFPLTDFPALAAALLAIVAVGAWRSPGGALCAGLAAGAAVNFRPAYVLLIPAVLALALVRRPKSAGWPLLARDVALILVGVVLISLPQSLAMHRHFDTWSPIPGSAAKLSSFQLTVGLERQRYETYVGVDYPTPQLNYYDKATDRVRAELDDGAVDGYPEYVGLVVQHPITMAGVFARRLINGLDQRYATPYVREVDPSRALRWLNFTVIFAALLRLLWPAARRSLGTANWRFVLALAVTSVTALPSAMETRFLLPVYLIAYLLALAPGWPNPLRAGEGVWARLAAPAAIACIYVAFMGTMWLVVRETTMQLLPPP
jgi:hypothetical protein